MDEVPVSGFSFLTSSGGGNSDGDLFGGREDNAESDKPEPSGFDFVQNGVTDVATESASAFSFLQSPSSPMEEAEESREHAPADAVGGSAFDFMQQPVEEEGAGSSFAFMAAEKVSAENINSARYDFAPETVKEIKLDKVAAARNVKKKRRATKVGYGRDEEGPEDEVPAQPIGVVEVPPAPSAEAGHSAVEERKPLPAAEPKKHLPAAEPTPLPSSPPVTAQSDSTSAQEGVGLAQVLSDGTGASASDRHLPSHDTLKKHSFFDYFRRGGPTELSAHSSKADAGAASNSASPSAPEKQLNRPAATPPSAARESSIGAGPPRKPEPSAGDDCDMFSGMDTSPVVKTPLKSDKESSEEKNSPSRPMPTSAREPEPVAAPVAVQSTTKFSSSENPIAQLSKDNSSPKPAPKDKMQESDLCETLTVLGDEIIEQIMTMMKRMSDERKVMLDVITNGHSEISNLEQEIQRARKDISEIESKQLHFGAVEDFDAAAALSDPLEICHQKVRRCQSRIQSVQADIQNAQNGISDSYKFNAHDLLHTVKGLGNIRRQKEEEVSKKNSEWEQKYAIDDVAVRGEEERIQLEMIHVLREEESLNEEGAVIETQITNQTETLSGTKSLLESRLHETLSEIAELELALAAKRRDEDEIRDELSKTETNISEVRRKYERQLQRIYDRRTAAQKAQRECSQEVMLIQRERDALAQGLVKHQHFCDQSKAWLELSEVGMRAVTEFSDAMTAALDLDITKDEPIADDTGLNDIRSKLMLCEAALVSAAQLLADKETQVSILETENNDICEKLPLLEVDKKMHASMKRFKEAAALSKDIKMMMTRKEDIEKQLELLSSEISLCQVEVKRCEDDIHVAKDELKAAEKDTDLLQFEILIKKAIVLNASKVRLNSFEFKVDYKISPIALKLIDVELKAALAKAAELKEKHGIERSLNEDELFTVHLSEITPMESLSEPLSEVYNVTVDLQGATLDNLDKEEQTAQDITISEEIEGEDDKLFLGHCQIADTITAEERELNMNKIKALQDEITEFEAQLEDAVNREEYDEAAALSDKMESLRRDLEETKSLSGMSLDVRRHE